MGCLLAGGRDEKNRRGRQESDLSLQDPRDTKVRRRASYELSPSFRRARYAPSDSCPGALDSAGKLHPHQGREISRDRPCTSFPYRNFRKAVGIWMN